MIYSHRYLFPGWGSEPTDGEGLCKEKQVLKQKEKKNVRKELHATLVTDSIK